MSTTAILLSMTIMFMDAETLKISKGPVVRETFTPAREAECSARLNQLMNSGGPGRMFAGYQPHPDGSMVPCQPTPKEVARAPAPRKGSEVYLLSGTFTYRVLHNMEVVKGPVVYEIFHIDDHDKCYARYMKLHYPRKAGYASDVILPHPNGVKALCDRTLIR